MSHDRRYHHPVSAHDREEDQRQTAVVEAVVDEVAGVQFARPDVGRPVGVRHGEDGPGGPVGHHRVPHRLHAAHDDVFSGRQAETVRAIR